MIKRLVVKVGTGVITTSQGTLDHAIMRSLVAQLSTLRSQGVDVVLVSSGAVSAGRETLHGTLGASPADKQAAAAVGQVVLVGAYTKLFQKVSLPCGQVLVTKEDFRDRSHYLNMRTCFEHMLKNGIVPIVNENDVVATSELLFTDNDELAGLVASQLNADAVIILSSVAGVLVDGEVVAKVTSEQIAGLKKHVTPQKSAFGRGGMLTKFTVALKLAREGIATYIADGRGEHIIERIVSGEHLGTLFVPDKRTQHVKRRVAHSDGLAKGIIVINLGAEVILRDTSAVASLLPIGIVRVEGTFEKGDVVEIRNEKNKRVGYGIARYNAARARDVVAVRGAPAFIHYNYLFIE